MFTHAADSNKKLMLPMKYSGCLKTAAAIFVSSQNTPIQKITPASPEAEDKKYRYLQCE